MQNKKKIISVILALIIALSAWSVVPFTANAAEAKVADTAGSTWSDPQPPTKPGDTEATADETKVDEAYPDYEYGVLNDGTAIIIKYNGKGSEATIPSTLGGYTVTAIGDLAYSDCAGLTDIYIPDTITRIGYGAFSNCEDLTSIVIPRSVTSISKFAFGHYLTEPNHVDTMLGFIIYGYEGSKAEKYALDDALAFVSLGKATPDEATPDEAAESFEYYVLDDGTAEITGYKGKGGDITIPSTLDGYTVTKIGNWTFSDYTSLTSVTIPDSVTSIGEFAFDSCTGLTSVAIGNSVTSIGYCAFCNCTGLTNLTIPDSVTTIGEDAFSSTAWYHNQPDGLVYAGKVAYMMNGKCPSDVVIKDGTLSIAQNAFSCCEELTNVTIPDSVTTIGRYAFYGCTGLTSIDIPDSVTSIGHSAFSDCTGLSSITIGNSGTIIGDYAFKNTAWYDAQTDGLIYIGNILYSIKGDCPAEVTIKPSTVTIADGAFYNQTNLSSVVIPDSVTNIGSSVFSGCTSLTSIDIPDSVTNIGGAAFDGCSSLTSIDIPDSVTSIGNCAFFSCTGLTSVTIPDSVTSIGSEAFGYYSNETGRIFRIISFTFYGYEGSEAEKYAKDNEFTFVPLKDKADKATGIILAVPEDTDLTVKDITAEIISSMPAENSKMTAYDISLTKDGEAVQPENIVPVKIPCANENAKVYRFETDGKMTDMNAKYKDGYMVFTTDHFSIYVLAEPKPAGVTVSGTITSYIDDSDVTVKLTGADNNFTAEVKGKSEYSIADVPAGEYTLTVSKDNHITREYTVTVTDADVTQDVKICPKGDVNGDGETDIMDCSVAQRYIRELTDLDPYQIACGDVSGTGDGELDIQDVSRILRHIRELAMLY